MHKLYTGDCLPSLKMLPSNSIHLVCIDPPYNTGMTRRKHDGQNTYEDRYDDSRAYLKELNPILNECKRVLTDNGSFFSFIDYREQLNYWLLLNKVFGEECYMDQIIWHWDHGGRPKNRWARKYNPIFWYSKDPDNYVCNLKESDRLEYKQEGRGVGKIPTNVWWYSFGTNSKNERVDYDGQKPLKIIRRIINVHSNAGDTVLDCFAGSGTTAVACDQTGRKAIIMERNEAAIPIIKSRMEPILGILPILEVIDPS